jgi:copper(I)-binding protein
MSLLSRLAAAMVPLLASATALAHEYRAGPLLIDHPWARATVSVQKVGAGYLTIRNEGQQADRLIGARSPIVPSIEMHTHEIDAQGVARMGQLEAIELPPGATVELAPGGMHLMLIGLSAPLREGEDFPLTLVFERAGEVEVRVDIEPLRGGLHHGGHGG